MAEDKKDFVVKDRRIFADEGKDKEEEVKNEKSSEKEAEPKDSENAEPQTQEAKESQLPEMNFPTFIMSMNASALVHLGVIEDPASGKKESNLPLAKQTIDILTMLEEKTRGNLSEDEEKMLKSILYDLKIIFVKEKG
jgi:hypothetical protein